MKRRHPAAQFAESLDVQRQTTRLGLAHGHRAKSEETTAGTSETTLELHRAERLGHRLASVSSIASTKSSSAEPVQREAKHEEDSQKLLKGKVEAPTPRLKLEDYLERRRLGRH